MHFVFPGGAQGDLCNSFVVHHHLQLLTEVLDNNLGINITPFSILVTISHYTITIYLLCKVYRASIKQK